MKHNLVATRRFHDETQFELDPSWPTSLQLDFASLELRVLAAMEQPLYGLRVRFAEALRKEDKNLFYKWLYQGTLTNTERDTVAIVARRVRSV
ncbi:hypothetical protein [Pseudomonas phage Nerthus]|uniref:Uncharacterized protein n=1 Tax=Pseudomonas phage Nerthus TaxID=2163984 RepID=A0A2S1GMM0_9CAUD|nr:hypothetical protein HOT09_gp06 [Pseudomonas phage Nerthus]AWD90638.1 hypothetical protein [Pseudomonas phage Nerthus]